MTAIAVWVIGISSVCLFAFGVNLVYLSLRSLRLPASPPAPPLPAPPLVCVQIPVYNERYVVERVVDAACRLDWPRDRLEIQILDDSDDDTAAIAAGLAARWRQRGLRISHLRRAGREGYKAGALAHGMTLTRAPFVAVLDADFVPPPGFLRGLMGSFADARVGFVQARWGHLNEDFSWFTRIQAVGIDFHFLVEHAVRSAAGYFTNFTGTAGVWRRAAIEDAGGWTWATLTEDLDLSYRAQLRGWRAVYRQEVVVPEELPVDINAYRRQQSRWATGSFQAARMLLWPLLSSRQPARVKWQGAAQLLAYGVGPLMLVQFCCYPVLLMAAARHEPTFRWGMLGLAFNVISLSPWVGFLVGQRRRGRAWWYAAPGAALQVMGAGMSLTVFVSLLRALRPGGEFRRTPKYRIERRGQEWRDNRYVWISEPAALGEAVLAVAAALVALVAFAQGIWLMALYSSLMGAGMLAWAGLTAAQAVQVVTLRKLGAGALAAAGSAARTALLLAPAAGLLAAVAMIGDPFEDSYHHWLIAATLATTGSLHDPLFGMQDTWLPLFHVVAAAVLKVAGTWSLWALKAMNAGLGLVTLWLTYRLAGSERRGRLAVGLLALNPVFLLTATSVVAEPLLLAALMGAVAALASRRYRLAAVLAALACLTGTKAWLWLGAAVAVQVAYEALGSRPRWRPAIGWAVPAIALLALVQLGFAPATHSVARASAEVGSAVARGSVAADPAARTFAFGWWFGLASLPLVALAPLGLIRELRAPLARLLHAPSLIYLAAITALVATGVYSGSHRYYYLALPSLALLAAAALDRVRAGVPLAAAAAAGLATIAFVPVFGGFAAQNAGLAAAGRAASGVPGRLLTDSPAAAYASGKPPAAISGSQALPAEPDRALAWLEAEGYTSLVIERIDYYRADQVFPSLAAGAPPPPFVALGDQAAYRSPGGKTTFAYALQPPEYQSPLTAGVAACLRPGATSGTGKTAVLQKGLTLERADHPLAGEGMGFGLPIVRAGGSWYLPGTAITADVSGRGEVRWRKTFELDRREVDTADGHFLRFETVPSQGRVQVTYTVTPGHIGVAVVPLALPADLESVVLLNEQSAAFDDFADAGQKLIGPAFGSYQPVRGGWARLRSSAEDLEWSLQQVPGAQLAAERERTANLDFAGLEYQFGPGFAGAAYGVEVMKAR